MKDYLSKIAEHVFGRNERISGAHTGFEAHDPPRRLAEQERDDQKRPRSGDVGIGYLPGDINEKMRRYHGPTAVQDDKTTPLHVAMRKGNLADAAELLAQGFAVGAEIQQHQVSTNQANRTKQLYLARKRGPRR